jgi:hypothetical protein
LATFEIALQFLLDYILKCRDHSTHRTSAFLGSRFTTNYLFTV